MKLNLTDEEIQRAIEKERIRTRRNGGILANNALVVAKLRASGLSFESIARIFSENGIIVTKEAVRRYFERNRKKLDESLIVSQENDVPAPDQIPVNNILKPEIKLFENRESELSDSELDDDLIPSPDNLRRRLEFE